MAQALFPATPGPNRAGTFQCTRLSSDVDVQAAAGFPPWMAWWQGAQTMSVLRRILAIRTAQAGGCLPGEVRSASLRTWWVSTVARWPHHSHWVQLVWSEQAGQAPSVYCPCLMPG